jgi:hypothetical protein
MDLMDICLFKFDGHFSILNCGKFIEVKICVI